jgi:hypothetical protein
MMRGVASVASSEVLEASPVERDVLFRIGLLLVIVRNMPYDHQYIKGIAQFRTSNHF